MFLYRKNRLFLQQGARLVPIQSIADSQKGPFYLYDIQALRQWYRFFVSSSKGLLKVFFAVKANSNEEVLKAFQKEGAGADTVSEGEIRAALRAGFPPGKIIFSGVGKTHSALRLAVAKKLFQINVESFEELVSLNRLCQKTRSSCRIGLRINPNVDFHAHPYIKTGLKGCKFGFEEGELPGLLSYIRAHKARLRFQGLSMHIGSQIFDPAPLFQAVRALKKLYIRLKKEGHPLKSLDIGGGWAVNDKSFGHNEESLLMKKYHRGLHKLLKDFEGAVITEPGRFLSAPFGLLCLRVECIKKSPQKRFAVLNGGMNCFLRPALYGARHPVLPLEKSGGGLKTYDVVGPICETGDTFAEGLSLPELKTGDWLAVAFAGAYGFVMANRYNLQAPPKEICFDGGKALGKSIARRL